MKFGEDLDSKAVGYLNNIKEVRERSSPRFSLKKAVK